MWTLRLRRLEGSWPGSGAQTNQNGFSRVTEHPDVPGLHRRLAGIRAYLEAARYQGEEWRKRARCNRALLAHVDVMDELLARED